MITRSQSCQQSRDDENQCPNLSIPNNNNNNKSSIKLPPLKQSSSSTTSSAGLSSPNKKQLQQWPSVKQLREQYETLPCTNTEVVFGGGQQRKNSSSSSGSSSAYRRRSGKNVVAVGSSKHEMRLKLRRVNDHVEAKINDGSMKAKQSHDDDDAADAASKECTSKEDDIEEVNAITTETNGHRIKEESADFESEPTMVQQKKSNDSSPTILSYSENSSKEVTLPTPKDFVNEFDGCRLKSNQTMANDEDVINGEVVEEEAIVIEESKVMKKNETKNCIIQLQEEKLCSSSCKKDDSIPTTATLKETVVSVKSECSTTTTSTGAKDILLCLSQLAFLGLTLFGVHHRYAQAQAISSQDPTKDSGNSPIWHQILHVGLVFALLVKAAYESTQAAIVSEGRMLRKSICCVRHLMIWAVTIPLYQKCSFGVNNICFVPTKMASMTSSAGLCIPSYSLFDVAVTNGYHALLSLSKSVIKGRLLSQAFREIQRALFNPFKFHARVQKALVILKWAKFFGPLIGTCNKFKGNLIDMARKKRQHRVSKAALKRWYETIDALSKQSKSEHAVVQLQKAFRERRVEKTRKRQLLMANRRWVRSKLEEEERLTRTKLDQIKRRDIDRQQRRQVSLEERRGIAQHRKSARKLMKRLLLNPKNYFSVIWKYLAVTCVALEVMTILFAPVLSGDVKKMPLDQFVVKVLRLGSRPQCNKRERDAPSLFVPSISSISDITCTGSKMKQIWFVTAHVIATMLVPAVNCICFLDVFVTFFTGELSSTGTLEPKPFVQRWILPGPVLQLIVNPTMSSIKTAVFNALGASIKIGPSLCLHGFLACMVYAVHLYDRIFDSILDVVERINEFNTKTKGQDDDEHLHWT